MLKKSLNFLPNIFGNIYFKHFVYCLSWSRLFRELLYSEMSHSNLHKSHKKYGPSLIKSIMPNNNNGLHFYNLYLHGLKYTLFWFQFLIPRTTMSQWMKCEVLNIDNFYSILLTFEAFVFVYFCVNNLTTFDLIMFQHTKLYSVQHCLENRSIKHHSINIHIWLIFFYDN